MEAVTMEDMKAIIDEARCIGCGLCVSTCPEEAISLSLKPENSRTVPPAHFSETYKRIAMERLARLQAMKSRG